MKQMNVNSKYPCFVVLGVFALGLVYFVLSDGIQYNTIHTPSPLSDIQEDWNIMNDSDVLRAAIIDIHNTNYKVKEDDVCVKTLPDCIIIGVGKSGTRELIDFMSIHPNIVSKSNPYQIRGGLQPSNSDYSRVINQMPCKYSDQISTIKADTYLQKSERPAEIFAMNPRVKLIAIVREPASRLISDLTMLTDERKTKQKDKYISNSKDMKKRIEYLVNTPYKKLTLQVYKSIYDDGLERYMKVFNKDQILVIESNELKYTPVEVLKRVEQFLGIKSFFSNEYFVFNTLKGFYCIRKPYACTKTMHCYSSTRGHSKQMHVDKKDLESLKEYFRPRTERFFKILGRRFDWLN
ncbi:Sulfotransferase [Mactra antiquata]